MRSRRRARRAARASWFLLLGHAVRERLVERCAQGEEALEVLARRGAVEPVEALEHSAIVKRTGHLRVQRDRGRPRFLRLGPAALEFPDSTQVIPDFGPL